VTGRGATRKQKPPRAARVGSGFSVLLRRACAGLALVAALTLLGSGAWFLKSMPVERVMITGELNHVDRALLQQTINESLSGGFLWLDLQGLKAPLEELPWVDRVVVRRQWPDSIEIRVIEQRAIARWGESALLNHAGEVFAPSADGDSSELPLLSGPDGSHARLMQYFRLVQEHLQPIGLQVQSLHMDQRGGLKARLAGGEELLFGREQIQEKLQRLQVLYARRLTKRRGDLASIDLRYSHGAAVAWKAGQDTQEET